jgi:DNA-binding NarL/FixJ family response regulator
MRRALDEIQAASQDREPAGSRHPDRILDAVVSVTSKPARVLVVDDHPAVADALTALINDERDMKVVGIAGSVAESVARATEYEPDIVLLDFQLPDGTGADAASVIRRNHPETKLIFVTRDGSVRARLAAASVGASAFIPRLRRHLS